jgi:hypothetical protein
MAHHPIQKPTSGKYGRSLASHYLRENSEHLKIDMAELPNSARVTVHGKGDVVQIYAPRVVSGVEVRGSYVTAVINNGNAVLFGFINWGDINISAHPDLTECDAMVSVQEYIGENYNLEGSWKKSELNILPMANGHDLSRPCSFWQRLQAAPCLGGSPNISG